MPPSADAAGFARRRPGLRLALFTDRRDWHARRLTRAFARRGVRAVALRLDDSGFDTTRECGVKLPGFSDALPDAALVRTVAGGSFEAITRRLGILHALRELGVPIWNDARAIERCVDKSMTSFLLARAGLPTPPTWTVEGLDAARAVVEREGGEGALVLKPLFGSQGTGLRLVRGAADLPPVAETAGVYHLQRFIEPGEAGFRDIRVFVVGGAVAAAMTRHGATWITNVKQGGRPERLAPSCDIVDLALGAARTVGVSFCGIDILEDRQGRSHVLEVNSMPAWSGLQTVSDVDIAGAIANGMIDALNERVGQRTSA